MIPETDDEEEVENESSIEYLLDNNSNHSEDTLTIATDPNQLKLRMRFQMLFQQR